MLVERSAFSHHHTSYRTSSKTSKFNVCTTAKGCHIQFCEDV